LKKDVRQFTETFKFIILACLCLCQWFAAEGIRFSGCLCDCDHTLKFVNTMSCMLLVSISHALQLRCI